VQHKYRFNMFQRVFTSTCFHSFAVMPLICHVGHVAQVRHSKWLQRKDRIHTYIYFYIPLPIHVWCITYIWLMFCGKCTYIYHTCYGIYREIAIQDEQTWYEHQPNFFTIVLSLRRPGFLANRAPQGVFIFYYFFKDWNPGIRKKHVKLWKMMKLIWMMTINRMIPFG